MILWGSAQTKSAIVLGEHVSFSSNPCRLDWVWGQVITRAISEVSFILYRHLQYKVFTLLLLLTRNMDTWQLSMCIITIRASLCRKEVYGATSSSKNEIGLLGNGGGPSGLSGSCFCDPHWVDDSLPRGGALQWKHQKWHPHHDSWRGYSLSDFPASGATFCTLTSKGCLGLRNSLRYS